MNAILVFWNVFFNVCSLKLKPQDLPASNLLLALSITGYILASASTAFLLTELPLLEASLYGLTETVLLSGLTISLMLLTNLSQRLVQTLTALTGTGTIFYLMTIPLMLWLEQAAIAEVELDFPLLCVFGVMIWNIVAYAHIFRHALNLSFSTAVSVSLLYALVIAVVMGG